MDPSSLGKPDKEQDYPDVQATLIGTFPPPTLITRSHPDIGTIVAAIADIHIACILTDGITANFLPPFTPEKWTQVLDWWQERFIEVDNDSRQIIVQFVPTNIHNDTDITQGSNTSICYSVVGAVMLNMPHCETGPFRGMVEKLLVSPQYRRRGIALRMMAKLEEVARQAGRTNIMLDTPTESTANKMYPRLGYTELGVVPDYSYSPWDNKTLMDETFYWKDLRKSPPLLPHVQPGEVRS